MLYEKFVYVSLMLLYPCMYLLVCDCVGLYVCGNPHSYVKPYYKLQVFGLP